jgi:hypothetical protein
MANNPDTMATNEAIKVTNGWKLPILKSALEMLTMVAVSAELWFVIYLRL